MKKISKELKECLICIIKREDVQRYCCLGHIYRTSRLLNLVDKYKNKLIKRLKIKL